VEEMSVVLEVDSISKEFGGNRVVNDVSFEVYKGEIMGILGPNGAGKSTIIRCIMGIIYPDTGRISFSINGSRDIVRSKVGYLPEERGLYKDVKVMDVLLYLAELKNYPRHRAEKRALEYLDKFDLAGKERVKVQELSKGMAQKVQLIASIIHEPQLLVLDEPFSGLDPVSQDVFMEEIKELAANGTAILLSSHQMNLVEALCNRIFLINRGKKVLYGRLDRIKEEFADSKCTIIGQNHHIDFGKLSSVDRVEGDQYRKTIYLKKNARINEFLRSIPEEADVRELHMDRISLHDIFVTIAKGGASVEG
jgi:ABC-2 type transport system ATP-binding protein